MEQAFNQINPFVVDRKSKYAVTSFPAVSEEDFKEKLKLLLKDKKFRTADHNIVAYRITGPDGRLLEYKNDGYNSPSKETGAGVMMLEIMRQKESREPLHSGHPLVWRGPPGDRPVQARPGRNR